ncbi:MAG: DUF4007 family protein [Lachnospiraceae bacterium]|nr:DUF4007 family protein [Lachnospiraceae bacterium]
MTDKKIKIRLQGHEKFVLREGWLNKGLIQIEENPAVFLGKDAPDVFGIGNNMVKSLRYWLKAFGLMEEKVTVGATLSYCGKIIKEYDVYFEDIFTLWVLHSNIVHNMGEATSWYLFFNKCDVEDMEKEQIVQILIRELKKYTNNMAFSEKSLRNDVDVILSMYGKVKKIADPEDKNISPFAQLDLIKNIDDCYSKIQPDRRKVTEWNVLYELSRYLCDRDYISIDEISEGIGSINAIYQIGSVAINGYLDKLDAMGYIRVDRTAGLDIIYKVADITPEMVMKEYYKTHR